MQILVIIHTHLLFLPRLQFPCMSNVPLLSALQPQASLQFSSEDVNYSLPPMLTICVVICGWKDEREGEG